MHCRINQMPTFFRRSVFLATTRSKPLSISLFRQTQRCQQDRLIYNRNLVRMVAFENANVRSCHDLLVSTAAPRAQYSARQVAAPFDTRVSRYDMESHLGFYSSFPDIGNYFPISVIRISYIGKYGIIF